MVNQHSFFTRDACGNLGGRIVLVPNPDRVTTINYACNAYGFLILRNETVTPAEFAARIRRTYDETVPQNAAVLDALASLV